MPSENRTHLDAALAFELAALRANDQFRTLTELQGVNLCSNDYLGLADDPRLKDAVLQAVADSSRVGATGSRLLSGHTSLWNELEDEFASFAGCEAALYFSSGYAANVGLLSSVVGKDDIVFSDALNHASLIDGIRLSAARRVIYPHLDLSALESALRAHSGNSCRKLIVTESIFSMDGDAADVRALQNLAAQYGAALVVDEAHATAVHGPDGRGLVAAANLTREVFAIIHTCGKALASAGAFVCGSGILREFLINRARTFIFSTAMPSYFATQIRVALGLAQSMHAERAALLQNAGDLATGLRSDGRVVPDTASQIVPVVIGPNAETLAAAQYLQGEGFAIRAIRPPTVPAGKARLRLSLTARISASQLARLRTALAHWQTTQLVSSSAGGA